MGAPATVYYLCLDKRTGDHELFLVEREGFSNVSEFSYNAVVDKVEAKILPMIEERHLTIVGIMEEFPTGDELYGPEHYDRLPIYYCHHPLNLNYLILGTAKDEGDFIRRAIEDDRDELQLEIDDVVKIEAGIHVIE